MIDVSLQEQTAAYLLGELSPAETAAFEQQLAVNATLRIHLRERQREMERLTLELAPPVDPPPAVRDRILAAAAADPRFLPVPAVVPAAPRRLPAAAPAVVAGSDWWPQFLLRTLGAALPLALLGACAVLWWLREGTERENRVLTERSRELARENESLRAAGDELTALRAQRERLEREAIALNALAETRAREVAALRQQLDQSQREVRAVRDEDVFPRLQVGLLHPPPSPPPGSTVVPAPAGVAVWDAQRQRGMLLVENLPVPRPDQDYQVWVGDPARAQPLPSGVFHPLPFVNRQTLAFVTNEKVPRASQFMVTLERKGGVARITGPAVLESVRQ